MASNGGEGAGAYIQHHLTDWCIGCNPKTHQVSGLLALHAFTVDLLLIAFVCALAIGVLALILRRRLSVDNPGRLQLTFEFAAEYITEQIQEVFPRMNHYVGAMALTIFTWVLFMNLFDLIPVDTIPGVAGLIGHHGFGMREVFFRDVPTAALDTPFAMAIVVFVMMVAYQIRANGPWGYTKRFLLHPYGKYAGPMNAITTLIDDVAKPVSLALRLFGNMFAGELVFTLLALLTITALEPLSASLIFWAPAQFIAGFLWSLFDFLIAVLQAFIFAVLAIVYLGMAQQAEA
jgi:F-type H+-transporting ATPase subunit a